jgi:hypothetical protein
MINKEGFIEFLRHEIDEAVNVWDRHKERFAADPAYTMTNCDHVFRAAAWISIGGPIVEALTKPDTKATLKTIEAYIYRQFLDKADSGSRSTSASYAIMQRAEITVLAKLTKMFKEIL